MSERREPEHVTWSALSKDRPDGYVSIAELATEEGVSAEAIYARVKKARQSGELVPAVIDAHERMLFLRSEIAPFMVQKRREPPAPPRLPDGWVSLREIAEDQKLARTTVLEAMEARGVKGKVVDGYRSFPRAAVDAWVAERDQRAAGVSISELARRAMLSSTAIVHALEMQGLYKRTTLIGQHRVLAADLAEPFLAMLAKAKKITAKQEPATMHAQTAAAPKLPHEATSPKPNGAAARAPAPNADERLEHVWRTLNGRLAAARGAFERAQEAAREAEAAVEGFTRACKLAGVKLLDLNEEAIEAEGPA